MSFTTDAAFAAARRTDPEVLSREQLADHLTDLRTVRAWLDAAEVRATRRGSHLAAEGSAGSSQATNTRVGRRSSKEAHAIAERTALCTDMPLFEAALDTGAVSAGHLDAVAHAARALDEAGKALLIDSAAAYLDEATCTGVDAFERSMRQHAKAIAAATAGASDADELEAQRRRSTVKRWVDKCTGMHHTHLELDPLRDAELWTAISAQLRSDRAADGNAKTPWAQMQVNTFVNAVKGTGSTWQTVSHRRPEIGVLIDFQTLVDDAKAAGVLAGVCETESGVPLPAATVRRMCCDADVYPVVLGLDGAVLDVGRTRRTATRDQRRALAAMHRFCAHTDCTVSFDACRIHHVKFWWQDLGATDLDNLLPLCERHHHEVHEGGWKLKMTPDRVATWLQPDGSTYSTGPTIDRTEPGERPGISASPTYATGDLG